MLSRRAGSKEKISGISETEVKNPKSRDLDSGAAEGSPVRRDCGERKNGPGHLLKKSWQSSRGPSPGDRWDLPGAGEPGLGLLSEQMSKWGFRGR